MKTNRKMNMITVGLMSLVFLLMTSMANAALVHIDPSALTVDPGDTILLSVKGSGFDASGVTSGGITLNWDPAVMVLNTTLTDVIIGGATTGFTDIFRFDNAAGQLSFTAATNILLPPVGIGGIEFTFLNLDFTAQAPPGTVLGVALGPDGPWQLGDFSFVPDSTIEYRPTAITVVNPVPVPGAVWLLGSGLLGLVGVVRRRGA